jgi:hypothetical protein
MMCIVNEALHVPNRSTSYNLKHSVGALTRRPAAHSHLKTIAVSMADGRATHHETTRTVASKKKRPMIGQSSLTADESVPRDWRTIHQGPAASVPT